jgi:hypothetical protein
LCRYAAAGFESARPAVVLHALNALAGYVNGHMLDEVGGGASPLLKCLPRYITSSSFSSSSASSSDYLPILYPVHVLRRYPSVPATGRNASVVAECGGFAVLTEVVQNFAKHGGKGWTPPASFLGAPGYRTPFSSPVMKPSNKQPQRQPQPKAAEAAEVAKREAGDVDMAEVEAAEEGAEDEEDENERVNSGAAAGPPPAAESELEKEEEEEEDRFAGETEGGADLRRRLFHHGGGGGGGGGSGRRRRRSSGGVRAAAVAAAAADDAAAAARVANRDASYHHAGEDLLSAALKLLKRMLKQLRPHAWCYETDHATKVSLTTAIATIAMNSSTPCGGTSGGGDRSGGSSGGGAQRFTEEHQRRAVKILDHLGRVNEDVVRHLREKEAEEFPDAAGMTAEQLAAACNNTHQNTQNTRNAGAGDEGRLSAGGGVGGGGGGGAAAAAAEGGTWLRYLAAADAAAVPGSSAEAGEEGVELEVEGAEGVKGAEGAEGVEVEVEGAEGVKGAEGAEGVKGAEGAEGVEGAEGAEGAEEGDSTRGDRRMETRMWTKLHTTLSFQTTKYVLVGVEAYLRETLPRARYRRRPSASESQRASGADEESPIAESESDDESDDGRGDESWKLDGGFSEDFFFFRKAPGYDERLTACDVGQMLRLAAKHATRLTRFKSETDTATETETGTETDEKISRARQLAKSWTGRVRAEDLHPSAVWQDVADYASFISQCEACNGGDPESQSFVCRGGGRGEERRGRMSTCSDGSDGDGDGDGGGDGNDGGDGGGGGGSDGGRSGRRCSFGRIVSQPCCGEPLIRELQRWASEPRDAAHAAVVSLFQLATSRTMHQCSVVHWRGVCCQAAADLLETAEAVAPEELAAVVAGPVVLTAIEVEAEFDEVADDATIEEAGADLAEAAAKPRAVYGLVKVLAKHAFERPDSVLLCLSGRRAALHLLNAVLRVCGDHAGVAGEAGAGEVVEKLPWVLDVMKLVDKCSDTPLIAPPLGGAGGSRSGGGGGGGGAGGREGTARKDAVSGRTFASASSPPLAPSPPKKPDWITANYGALPQNAAGRWHLPDKLREAAVLAVSAAARLVPCAAAATPATNRQARLCKLHAAKLNDVLKLAKHHHLYPRVADADLARGGDWLFPPEPLFAMYRRACRQIEGAHASAAAAAATREQETQATATATAAAAAGAGAGTTAATLAGPTTAGAATSAEKGNVHGKEKVIGGSGSGGGGGGGGGNMRGVSFQSPLPPGVTVRRVTRSCRRASGEPLAEGLESEREFEREHFLSPPLTASNGKRRREQETKRGVGGGDMSTVGGCMSTVDTRVSFDVAFDAAAAAVMTPAEDAELGGGSGGRRALRRRLRSSSFGVLNEVQPVDLHQDQGGCPADPMVHKAKEEKLGGGVRVTPSGLAEKREYHHTHRT